MEEDRARIRLELAAQLAEQGDQEVSHFDRIFEDAPQRVTDEKAILRASLIRYNREVIQRFMDMK